MLTADQFRTTAEEWDKTSAIVAGLEEDPSEKLKCYNCEVSRHKPDMR